MTRLLRSFFFVCIFIDLGWSLKSLNDRFYQTLEANSAVACFRLTNATNQIGCSASTGSVRGVLLYVGTNDELDRLLHSAPHPPFIALLEPQNFTKDVVLQLYENSRVKGIVIRYHDESSAPGLTGFSPERKCPSDGFGYGECRHPWNPTGSEMSFMDFKDFPIFAVENKTFSNDILECYNANNVDLSGGVGDYPLCSIELYADMDAAIDTPTCFRRANLPMPYLNGVSYCDPLGDLNVWGTMLKLPDTAPEIIMLATKVDSNSFFLDHSYGANSEVAGIVTLLAVVDQLGRLKRSSDIQLNSTRRSIMYTFFHGESWDYIGSSRMVYDMQQNVFPSARDKDKTQLPLIKLENVTTFFELSHLGMDSDTDTLYIHGSDTTGSPLVTVLNDTLREVNLTLNDSTGAGDLRNLPPASLQRFLRARDQSSGGISNFKGYVLATYDQTFTNRFYHSRFDNIRNLESAFPLDEVAERLADIATAIARGAVSASEPVCSEGPCNHEEITNILEANSTLIENLLECFLVNPNCSLFQSVLVRQLAVDNLYQRDHPLSRYITTNQYTNLETVLIYQLVAYLGATYQDNITNYVPCDDCYNRFNATDQTKNTTVMQWQSKDEKKCLCVESYTYQHTAESPAFDRGEYNSKEYSTWAESRWTAISARIYLITYTGQEVAVLFGGTILSVLTFIIAFLCKRKADDIFEPKQYGLLQQ